MTQFQTISLLLNALALIFQVINVLHPLIKENLKSTETQMMEDNHEQDA